MKKLITGTLVALAMSTGMNTALADDGQYAAKTVWVNGKGQGSMADKVTKQHEEMAKQGWKFASLDVYVEDGDMKGFFATYVREPVPAPVP